MTTKPDYVKYPMVLTYVSLARSYKEKGELVDAFRRFEKALDVCYMTQADSLIDNIQHQMLDIQLPEDVPEEVKIHQQSIKRLIEIKENFYKADFDTAKQELHELIDKGTKDPELYILLGKIALQENKKDEAARNLLSAAEYCFTIRAIKKAEFFCDQVLRLDPGRLEARSLIAEIYQKQGSINHASIEILTLAREYLKKNQLKKAFGYVQKAVEMGNMEAHYIQGLIYFHEGRLDEAKEKFELLNTINQQHAGSLSYLARIYQKKNLSDSALKTYDRLIYIKPDDPSVYFDYAATQLQRGLIKEALSNYQKASQLFAKKGRSQEAESATRMADQLWQSLKDEERSARVDIPVKQKSPDIKPGDKTDFIPIGSDEHYTAAQLISMYKKALQIGPDNEELKKKLQFLEETVSKQPAVAKTTKNAAFIPVNQVTFLTVAAGQRKQIVTKLTDLLKQNPSDERLKFKLAELETSLPA